MSEGRVLVIDDDPVICTLLRVNFEIEGFDVSSAPDGSQGLQAAESHPPDAIVLDVMMPGLDGLEVARRLRSAPSTASIPIVLLSAKAQASDVQAGLAVGDDYVTKPFEPLDLLKRVRAAMEARRPGPAG